MKNRSLTIELSVIVVIVSLFGSCKISKDISLPDAGLPGNYAGQKHADTTSVGKLSWHEFFADAELKKLIADALSRNYDLQVAVKNIESASLILRQAKLGNVPTLDIQATASGSRPSDNS